MTAFLLAAALLTVLVLALIARPFLFGRAKPQTASMAGLNIAILREEIATLEAEHSRGSLSNEAFAVARDEVQRRLLEENADEAPPPLRPARAARLTLLPLAVLLPLMAIAFYAVLGTPAALREAPTMANASGATAVELEKAVAILAAKLKANPDNPQGWAMLGRSYKVMRRFDEAVAAFEQIGPALEQNADWLVEYASVLAMASGGNLEGKPETLAIQALKVDPNQPLALMLAGSAAGGRQDFASAIMYLERAQRVVPEDSEEGRFLKEAIAQAHARLADTVSAATQSATAPTPAATTETAPPATQGRTIALAIGIAPALKADAAGKTLFVIARAPGERMPIAVIRRSADGLPATFTLDDSASLNPSRPLSSIATLEIEARVSASGIAQSAAGDLFGTAKVADASVTALALQINQKRP